MFSGQGDVQHALIRDTVFVHSNPSTFQHLEERVQAQVEMGASPFGALTGASVEDYLSLVSSAFGGMKYFLSFHGASPDGYDIHGFTPAHYLVNNAKVFSSFVTQYKPDLTIGSRHTGETAAFNAVTFGRLDTLQVIHQLSPEAIHATDDAGCTLMHCAVENHYPDRGRDLTDIVEFLTGDCKTNEYTRNTEGLSAYALDAGNTHKLFPHEAPPQEEQKEEAQEKHEEEIVEKQSVTISDIANTGMYVSTVVPRFVSLANKGFGREIIDSNTANLVAGTSHMGFSIIKAAVEQSPLPVINSVLYNLGVNTEFLKFGNPTLDCLAQSLPSAATTSFMFGPAIGTTQGVVSFVACRASHYSKGTAGVLNIGMSLLKLSGGNVVTNVVDTVSAFDSAVSLLGETPEELAPASPLLF